MATNNVKLNIKYGNKSSLPTTKTDGTLYVALKNDGRAELHVHLDGTDYIISESLPVDNTLNSDSANPIQNATVTARFNENETKLQALEEALGEFKEVAPDTYYLKTGGEISGSVYVTETITAEKDITAPNFLGNANTATTAETLSSKNIGDSSTPVYFNSEGKPQAATDFVSRIDGIEEALGTANENINVNADSINTLNNNFSSLSTRVGITEGKVSTLEGKMASAENAIDAVEERTSVLETDMAEVQDAIASKAEQSTVTSLTTALNTETINRENADNALDKRLTAAESVITTLEDKDTDLEKNITNVSDALADHIDDYATGSAFGHVKLLDSVSSNSAASAGIAATPNAVKTVNDALNTHINSAKSTYATKTELEEEIDTREAADTAIEEALGVHIAEAKDLYIYVGDEVSTTGAFTLDAETLGGMTKDEIIAAAKGESEVTGTVGFTTGSATSPTSVILTNVTSGKHLYPQTNVANITDIASNYVKFKTGTTAPTDTIGTIWFYGSSAPYQIRIWNGSVWEVMNSWQ